MGRGKREQRIISAEASSSPRSYAVTPQAETSSENHSSALEEHVAREQVIYEDTQVQAAVKRQKELRSFIADDAHHHMSTVAGMLRLLGRERDDTELTRLGDELAECCARARAMIPPTDEEVKMFQEAFNGSLNSSPQSLTEGQEQGLGW
jgi:hypothetical protein